MHSRTLGEHGVDVVAHQRAAEGKGVGAEVGVAAQLDLQSSDVEGAWAFGLQLVVIDDGVIAGHDFGDGVGQVGAAVAAVVFDDGGVAVRSGDDEDARMRGGGVAVGGGSNG